MNENIRTVLFIPAYNVAQQLPAFLETLTDEILAPFVKVYVVDNRSSDETLLLFKTWAQSLRLSERVEIYQNKENVFLGGSTALAFDMSLKVGAHYIVCMHSDGQASVKELSRFIDFINEDKYDFILGSRFLPKSQTRNYSRLRYVFNVFFAHVQQMLIKQKVYDIGAFIGFRLKTVKSFDYNKVPFDMGFHPYLILILSSIKQNLKFKEFPIYWGQVESTNVNVWIYGIVHLTRILKLKMGIYPKEIGQKVQSVRIY